MGGKFKTINVIASESKNYEIEGYSILWNSGESDENGISINTYVDQHGDQIRDKYNGFIRDLGNSKLKSGKTINEYFQVSDGHNVWWMSLLVEKNLVKSPAISNCLKLFALEQILSELKPKKLRLFCDDKNLTKTITLLCNELHIEIIPYFSGAKLDVPFARMKNMVPKILKGFLYIWINTLKNWSLRRLKTQNWHSGIDQIFLFSQFINFRIGSSAKSIYSKYWEVLPELLNKKGVKMNFLNNYHNSEKTPSIQTAVRLVTEINIASELHGEKHFLLYSFISVASVWKVIRNFLKICSHSLQPEDIFKFFQPAKSKLNFWYLLNKDWNESTKGAILAENLMLISLVDKAIESLPRQNLGLYLQENNGWERALIHSWKKYQNSIIIGVPHTTIRYWDLRYIEDKRLFSDMSDIAMPRPDYVSVNGPIAKKMLLDSGYPKEELVDVEALRYLDFSNNDASESNTGKRNIKNNYRILVCGDIDMESTSAMLRSVERTMATFRENKLHHHLVYKSHPVSRIELGSYSIPGITETFRDVKDILSEFDIMIATDSTSAGVEAYSAGLKVIVFTYAQRVNFSPLKGVSGVVFVSNEQSLSEALLSEDLLVNNNKPEPFFWTDKKLPKWSKIFKDAGYSNFN